MRTTLFPSPVQFLDRLFYFLTQDGVQVDAFPLDHLCYRVETVERYAQLCGTLAKQGALLSEKEIGGRPIAVFKLQTPFSYQERAISLLELPAPKPGSAYPEGYEHAEFVVDEPLQDFMARYLELDFDTKGLHKAVNPEVRLRYEGLSVKFHEHDLEYVITELDP